MQQEIGSNKEKRLLARIVEKAPFFQQSRQNLTITRYEAMHDDYHDDDHDDYLHQRWKEAQMQLQR